MDLSFALHGPDIAADAAPEPGMQPLLLATIMFSPLFWIVLFWWLLA